MQANAPCESTLPITPEKGLSHFLPGRLLTLSSLKKLDRCPYCIPVLSSYDNELTAFADFWNLMHAVGAVDQTLCRPLGQFSFAG